MCRDVRKSYRDKLNSLEWFEFRNRQLERANNECWNCGSWTDLEVHHLIYRNCEPWEYADEEVRVLCGECHTDIHVVSDDIWVHLLRFQPHELELILKRLKTIKDVDRPNGWLEMLKKLRVDFKDLQEQN